MNKNGVTIKEIQKYCKKHFNVTAKNTYIAHAKELNGIPVLRATNRKSDKRLWPCPVKMQPLLKIAFIDLGIIQQEPTSKTEETIPKTEELSQHQTSMIKQFKNSEIEEIKEEFNIK